MQKNGSSATIVDIARLANVTNITVSRAFNRPELVKPATRAKIHAIAKELNYVPNAFAQGLKKNSSQIIGVITSSMYSPFYSGIIQTVSRIARAGGYQIMLFDTDGSQEAEAQAIQTLFSYKACGILLSAVRDDKDYQPDYLELAETYHIPLILMDRDIYNRQLSGVFLNNKEIGRMAGKYLAQQSAENILIISGPIDSEITRIRNQAICKAMENSNKKIQFIYGDYNFISQQEEVKHYLANPENCPDYIVGLNGIITLGAIAICHALNIYQKIKFFSIDEPPHASQYGVHIAGIYHDTQILGEIVADLLFGIIKSPAGKNNSQREFYTGSLVIN